MVLIKIKKKNKKTGAAGALQSVTPGIAALKKKRKKIGERKLPQCGYNH